MLAEALLALQLAALAVAAWTGRSAIRRLMAEARGHGSPPSPDLSEVDAQILRYIEGKGGAAYQSEIVRDLSLPKSTVHKALRRLAEGGYVEVVRQGRVNLVLLREIRPETARA